jgi:hypothetical protein
LVLPAAATAEKASKTMQQIPPTVSMKETVLLCCKEGWNKAQGGFDMSQLVDRFKAAVDAFDGVKAKGEYRSKVRPFLDQAVVMNEVDPPNTKHSGIENVISYLEDKQVDQLPQFKPDYNKLKENPQNSDNATSASVDGPASYQDISKSGSKSGPVTNPFQITYRFEFRRASTTDPWQITLATAK